MNVLSNSGSNREVDGVDGVGSDASGLDFDGMGVSVVKSIVLGSQSFGLVFAFPRDLCDRPSMLLVIEAFGSA